MQASYVASFHVPFVRQASPGAAGMWVCPGALPAQMQTPVLESGSKPTLGERLTALHFPFPFPNAYHLVIYFPLGMGRVSIALQDAEIIFEICFD